MLTKLGCYIKDLIGDVKRKFIANKLVFYFALAALALGILVALSKDYSDCDNTNNFIFVVCNGNSSPIPQILRIVLWLPLVYIAAYVASVHFVAFVAVGFGGVAMGAYFLMRNAFTAVAGRRGHGTRLSFPLYNPDASSHFRMFRVRNAGYQHTYRLFREPQTRDFSEMQSFRALEYNQTVFLFQSVGCVRLLVVVLSRSFVVLLSPEPLY